MKICSELCCNVNFDDAEASKHKRQTCHIFMLSMISLQLLMPHFHLVIFDKPSRHASLCISEPRSHILLRKMPLLDTYFLCSLVAFRIYMTCMCVYGIRLWKHQ